MKGEKEEKRKHHQIKKDKKKKMWLISYCTRLKVEKFKLEKKKREKTFYLKKQFEIHFIKQL